MRSRIELLSCVLLANFVGPGLGRVEISKLELSAIVMRSSTCAKW